MANPPQGRREKLLFLVPFLGGAMLILQAVSRIFLEAPLPRVLELTLCRSYYRSIDPSLVTPGGYVPDELCTAVAVRTQLSSTFGRWMFASGLCGLLAAPVYLYLAERVDRRILISVECVTWVTGLAFSYSVCYFDDFFNIRVIYLSSLTTLLGGSRAVAQSLLFAIVAESVSAAALSKTLFYISAGIFLGRICGMAGVAWLMNIQVWWPVVVGSLVFFASMPILLLLPEPRKSLGVDYSLHAALLNDEEDVHPTFTEEPSQPLPSLQTAESAKLGSTYTEIKDRVLRDARAVKSMLRQSPSAGTCLAVYFFYNFGMSAFNVLNQWASKMHGWSLADVLYVFSLVDFLGGITLLVLPTIGRFLRRQGGLAGTTADMLVAKTSLIFILVGFLCMGLSWSKLSFILALLVMELGFGFSDALKAYVTATNPKDFVTSLYVAIAVMSDVAGLVGALFWSGILNVGLNAGGHVGGLVASLPLWVASACMALATGLLLRLASQLRDHKVECEAAVAVVIH